MISLEINENTIPINTEQNLSNIKKLLEFFPKNNLELQAVIKAIYTDQSQAEIAIPFADKTINLLLKFPEKLNFFDKAFFSFDYKQHTFSLKLFNGTDINNLELKLSESFLKLLKSDFSIKNIHVINTNISNFSDNDLPQIIPVKPIEILPSSLVGHEFEAFILKNIPIDIQKNVSFTASDYIKILNLTSIPEPNSKLLIEITGIHPQISDTGTATNQTDQETLSLKDVTSLLTDSQSADFSESNKSVKTVYQDSESSDTGTFSIKTEEKNNSHIEKTSLNTENLKNRISPDELLKENYIVKGIVISKPEEETQKIMLSNVGIISLPSLKEKLPFKSVIDIQIKDVMSPEEISNEYTISDKTPYNSVKKIMEELSVKNERLLYEFTKKLPALNKHILTRMVKFIKAINHRNPYEIFEGNLLDRIENELGNRKFLTEILKKDFTEPLNVISQNPNNQFSMYILPLLNNDNISKMWLYLFTPAEELAEEDDDENNGKNKKNRSKQRFLLEAELSELGNTQFEGLLDYQNHRLDVQIKTKQEFSQDEKKELNSVYLEAMSALNYIGELKFKTEKDLVHPFQKAEIKSGYYL